MLSEPEKAVLAKQSVLGKIALPCDRRLVPPGLYGGIVSLYNRGFMTCIDRNWMPPWGGPVSDVFQITPAGRAALKGD